MKIFIFKDLKKHCINLFFICIIFLVTSIFSNEDFEIGRIHLEWSSIKNAQGYQIQIKDKNNKIVYDQKTQIESVKVELHSGQYQRRIGVFNKKGKIAAWTPWSSFQAIVSKNPELIPLGQKVILEENQTGVEFKITGKNFSPTIIASLNSTKSSLSIKKVEFINSKTIKLTIDVPLKSEDEYDLILENPNNKKKVFGKVVRVKKEKVIVSTEDTKTTKVNKEPEYVVDDFTNRDDPPTTNPTDTLDDRKYANDWWSALWRSTLFPGWGQLHRGDKVRPVLYPFFLLAGSVVAYKYRTDYALNKKITNNKNNIWYLLPTNTKMYGYGLLSFYTIDSSTQKANRSALNYRSATSFVLAIYAINLLDAAFLSKKSIEEPPVEKKTSLDFNMYISIDEFSHIPQTVYEVNYTFQF